MREVFRGWRRKIGCVMLVMACLAMVAWMRSLFIQDWFSLPIRSAPWLLSRPSGLTIAIEGDEGPPYSFTWNSMPTDKTASTDPFAFVAEFHRIFYVYDEKGLDWRWDFIGFHFCGYLHQGGGIGNSFRWYVIPYWSIALPPTLLSAYLLLSKPRQPNPQSPSKSPQETAVSHA